MSHDAHHLSPTVPGDSAPEVIAWCSRCRGAMHTRIIQGKPRRVCSDCGAIHFVEAKVAVGVCVVQHDELLLVKRRFNPEKGKWSLPAGFLDAGEDPTLCAAREVLEETGLRIQIASLMSVIYNPPQAGGATLFVLYRGEHAGGALKAGDDAPDARFFPVEALPELAFESTRRAVDLLKLGTKD